MKVWTTIKVFAENEDLYSEDFYTVEQKWNEYIELALKLGYSMDFICDTILYSALDHIEDYDEDLQADIKKYFCS